MIANWWHQLRSRQVDSVLLAGVIGLSLVGVVMVMSASLQIAEMDYNTPFHFFKRHVMYWLMAVAVGVFSYVVLPLERFKDLGLVSFFIAVAVLLLLFIPGLGHEVNGSLRWLRLPGFTVQPSELAKFFFIVYLAGYITQRHAELMVSWKVFLAPVGLLIVLAVLLLKQPDFGALVVIGCSAMGMLFLAGTPLRRFIPLLLIAAGVIYLLASSQPYRVARLLSYTNPWQDQFGSGYQLTQSLIAFGRGGWFGVGLGNSVQKLFYLPEAHTDFVYAVIAEEFGLLGNLLLIAGFGLVVARMFWIGWRLAIAGWWFHALCVYGFALVFSAQAMINLGVNMGVLPTKGLTLPFVSYGGSSLIVSALMVALALRADADLRAVQAPKEGKA